MILELGDGGAIVSGKESQAAQIVRKLGAQEPLTPGESCLVGMASRQFTVDHTVSHVIEPVEIPTGPDFAADLDRIRQGRNRC